MLRVEWTAGIVRLGGRRRGSMRILLGGVLPFVALLASPTGALAHCPLCTAGSGLLAGIATSLGVSTAVVGVLVGGFALALGIWMARLVRKRYVRYQDELLVLSVFLATVLPLMPLADEYRFVAIPLAGEPGAGFPLNLYLVGAAVGAILLLAAPHLSRTLTKVREGVRLPFQGTAITFLLLIAGSLGLHWIL